MFSPTPSMSPVAASLSTPRQASISPCAARLRLLSCLVVLVAAGACFLALSGLLPESALRGGWERFGASSSPTAASAAASYTAGSIPGDFSVNQDGAAGYELSLTVPPGTGGVQPSLSLVYSSGGGDGLAGMGWALDGLSAISRCGATLATDGFAGGVEYNAGDRFCLDGMRLVRVDSSDPNQPYYQPGAVYHTQKETWRRVVGNGDCVGGPCSFTVQLKNGTVLAYGTGSAQVLAVGAPFAAGQPLAGAVRVWALAQATDLDGNSMAFAYTQEPKNSGGSVVAGTSGAGQYYPQRIDYTTNGGGGLAAQRSVQFLWEGRNDAPARYQGGALIRTAARLQAVRTCLDAAGIGGKSCGGGNLVQEWLLGYPTYSSTTGRSLLGSVTQCGADGLCFNPTTFTYQPGDNALVSVNGPNNSNKLSTSFAFCDPANGELEWADFTGDGLPDWICNNPSGQAQGAVWVLASDGSQLAGVGGSSSGELANRKALCAEANGEVTWADFNGDGMVDWVCNNPTAAASGSNVGSTWVLLSTGDDLASIGADAYGLLPNRSASCGSEGASSQVEITWADFNGDSRLDWICNDPTQSGQTWVLLSDGTDLAKTPASNQVNGLLPLAAGLTGCAGGAENTRWADFTGDGLVDWICNQPDATQPQSGFVWVLASNGATLEPVGPYPDGQLNQGSSFSAICDESVGSAEWFDFNGDGLTDWICNDYLASGNVQVLLSTGKTLESAGSDGRGSLNLSTAKCPQGSVMSWMDFNGDDLVDWTCADPQSSGNLTVLLSDGSTLAPLAGTPGGSLGTNLALCNESGAFPEWADFNGDGLADWVCNQPQAGSTGDRNGFVWVSLNEPPMPDSLTGIVDGLGGTTEIAYEPLTAGTVYTKKPTATYPQGEATAFPNLNLDQPLYVVSEYTLTADPERVYPAYSYTYRYHYAGGLLNLQGLGFLGFAEVSQRDDQMQTHLTTYYHQRFPFDGEPDEKVLCQGTDLSIPCAADKDFLMRNGYRFYCQEGSGGEGCSAGSTFNPYPGIYQILLAEQREESAGFGYELLKSYAYDRYGNLTRLDNQGDVAAGHASHPLVTCSQYSKDEERWLLGFELNEKTSTASACPSNWDTYQFAPATDLTWQRTTYTEAMNVASALSWDSSRRIWLGTEYAYGDAFGNVTSQTTLSGASPQAVAGTTSTTTYDSTFHAFPAEQASPPATAGQAGTALVQSFAYDPRFGIQVGQTATQTADEADAGSLPLVSTACLDSLGRTAAVQGPQAGTGAGTDTNCLQGQAGIPGSFGNAAVVTLAETSYHAGEQARPTVLTEVRLAWGATTWDSAEKAGTRTYFDGLGRTWRTDKPGDGGRVVQETQYLTQKLVRRRSLPFFDGTPGADVEWITTTYDELGRRRSVTRPYEGPAATRAANPCTQDDPATTVTTCWAYGANNTITVTQAANTTEARAKTHRFEYFDDDRRTVTMTTQGEGGGTTTYAYDALGRPLQVIDPGGVANLLTYDSLSRRTTFTETNIGATTYAYDAVGNLQTTTDAEGRQVVYAYDPLNRPRSKTLKAADGSTTGNTQYTYDSSPEPSTYLNTAGRLAALAKSVAGDGEGDSSYLYGYDSYGNSARSTLTLTAGDGSTAFPFVNVFDPQGRVSSRTYPDAAATVLTTAFTPGGQLGSLALADAASPTPVPYVAWSDFDALGKPAAVTFGSTAGQQAAEHFTYLNDGRVATHAVAESDGTQAFAEAYAWDRFGNLGALTDCNFQGNAGDPACAGIGGTATEDLSSSYSYQLSRLTGASGPFGELSFGYTPGGNLTSRATGGSSVTFTYDGQQVVTGTDGFSAGYDDVGNMETKRTAGGTAWAYTWSVENQLQSAHKNVGGNLLKTAAFAYDDSGQRLVKTTYADDGVTLAAQVLYPARDFEVMPAQDGRDAQYTVYLTGPDGRVGAITRAASAGSAAQQPSADVQEAPPGTPIPGTTKFFIANQVGSTRTVIDGAGRVTSRVLYLPYGGIVDLEGADDFRPKFDGQELDSATGLYYFNARYYDAGLGRFVSADDQPGASPFSQDAWNRYAFGLNNPVRYSDPSGHFIGRLRLLWRAIEPTVRQFGRQLSEEAYQRYVRWQLERLERGNDENRRRGQLENREEAEVRGPVDQPNLQEPPVQNQHDGCSIMSFQAGTPIATENGETPIETLRSGDQVWAFDEAKGERGLYPVGRIYTRVAPEYLVLSVGVTKSSVTEISVTAEHPFFVPGKGWLRADELTVGDALVTLDGERLPIRAIEHRAEALTVFNFSVDEARTYYVSPARVLAHNCGDGEGRNPESGEDLSEGVGEGAGESAELSEGSVTEMGGELGEATGEVTADAAEAVGEIGVEAGAEAAGEAAVGVAAEVGADAAAAGGADVVIEVGAALLSLLLL